MPAQIERRLQALEARRIAPRAPLLIVRRVVAPGQCDKYPAGTRAAPPYLPAVDRLPSEGWGDFTTRLRGMIAHHPAGTVVRVVSC